MSGLLIWTHCPECGADARVWRDDYGSRQELEERQCKRAECTLSDTQLLAAVWQDVEDRVGEAEWDKAREYPE